MLLLWTNNLSVGIEVFDADHKKLIGMVNKLHAAIESGETLVTLATVIDQMEGYIRHHCLREEALFLETDYPHAAEHKLEHRELFAKIAEIKSGFATEPDLGLAIEAMEFLNHWAVDHIHNTDRKYSSFLHSKGIF